MIKWIELEDQEWFPSYLRRMQTDYIGWLVHVTGLYHPLAAILEKALVKLKSAQIVDMCSGNGAAIASAVKNISPVHVDAVYLSDKFPSVTQVTPPKIQWISEPVDVLQPGVLPSGLRTIFNAFHHFKDKQVRLLFQANAKQGLFICEILEPRWKDLLKILFTTTVVQFLSCFFVKPFRIDRIFFTCVFPVNLITVSWDGVISVLKSDRQEVVEKILRQETGKDFTLHCGSYTRILTKVNWFLILPVPEK